MYRGQGRRRPAWLSLGPSLAEKTPNIAGATEDRRSLPKARRSGTWGSSGKKRAQNLALDKLFMPVGVRPS